MQGEVRRHGHAVAWAGALLFIAAIKTPPLYHSNQNTKFLHALARAFPDRLGGDWTAGTVDGLPVFSEFVYLVARWLHPLAFYVVEAGLLALLAVSLIAVGRAAAPRHGDDPRLGYGLAVGLAAVAAINAFDGLAGQYLFNGYLQPSEFGALFVFAAAASLAGRHRLAAFAAALPATLHPAYIPVAAVMVAAVWCAERRALGRWPRLWVVLAAAAIVVAPQVDLALRFAPTDPETFRLANRILAVERIPHHSIPALWFDGVAALKLAVAAAALALAPKGILRNALAGLLGYVVLGTLAVVVTDYEGLMLLAPWRGSVVLMPLSIAVLAGRGLDLLLPRLEGIGARRAAAAALAVIAVAVVVRGSLAKYKTWQAARPADWVVDARARSAPGDLFLTDPDDHTFRLAAMTPQLVSWKSHPYFDREVLEWRTRLELAQAVYGSESAPRFDCVALQRLLEAYPVTHVVRPAGHAGEDCRFLAPWFEGRAARVYRVDRDRL